jgi:hypothetical protein
MSRHVILIVEVIEPYSTATLRAFDIEPGTTEEYAFCLGWQDGVTNYFPAQSPVTNSQAVCYQSGWALGSLNRIVWLVQSSRKAMATETEWE